MKESAPRGLPTSTRFLKARSRLRCIALVVLFVSLVLSINRVRQAQQLPFVGTNINVAAGVDNPFTGDPHFQKDTESCAMVSPRDPQTRVIAYIDFAPVTTSGDPEQDPDAIYFEAWPVLAVTHDGLHFYKVSFPGRPGTSSPADLSSPAYGMQFGSDPMCATTPGGKLHVIWLAGIRGGGSRMIVSTFEHQNNLEGGVSIVHLYSKELDRAKAGDLVDKPAIIGDTSGRLLACWTYFKGEEDLDVFKSYVYCARSLNQGLTWTEEHKVSKGFTRNQAVLPLLNPVDGSWHVIWRQIAPVEQKTGKLSFAADTIGRDVDVLRRDVKELNDQDEKDRDKEDGDNENDPEAKRLESGDRMLMVSSSDSGKSWSNPVSLSVDPLPVHDLIEQGGPNARVISFRATAYPAGGFGGDGKLYVAWTQLVRGTPKIVIATGTPQSPTSYKWTAPTPVADGNDLQILPAVATGGGQISVAYVAFPPGYPNTTALLAGIPNNVLCPDGSICGLGRRMEARLVQASIPSTTPNPTFSAPAKLTRLLLNTTGQEINKWGIVNPGDDPNNPIWRGGYNSFIGDYFGLAAGQQFVQTGNSWRWATQATDYAARNVFAAIPSNRDVVDPPSPNITPWTYAAATGGSGPGRCGVNALSRDANMFMVEVFSELKAYAHVTSRKLTPDLPGTDVELRRSFPFTVEYRSENPASPAERFFRLTAVATTAGVDLSFTQPPAAPLTELRIRLAKNTSFTWTVNATSANPDGRFRILVDEIERTNWDTTGPVTLKVGGKNTAILFNEDPTNPAANRSVNGVSINTKEIHTPVFSSPLASSPLASSPLASSPLASSPLASSPLASSPVNASYSIASVALNDPLSANQATRDIAITVQNIGNAASSYNGFVHIPELQELLNSGYQFQVIVERVYNTPFLDANCQIKQLALDEVVANLTSNTTASPLASSKVVSSPLASSPLASSPAIASPLASSPLASSPLASSATFAIAPASPLASSLTVDAFARVSALLPADDLTHGGLGPEANQVKIIVRAFAPTAGPMKDVPFVQLPPPDPVNGCGGPGQPGCPVPPDMVEATVVAQRPNTGEVIPPSVSTLPLNIETVSLPDGAQNVAYETQTIAVSGGTGPFTFALMSGTSLPPGLTLISNSGQILGTPTVVNTAGTTFTIQVTDSKLMTATRNLTIRVVPPFLNITTTSLPNATANLFYNQALAATGGLGTQTWSLFSGSLPTGLTMSAAGAISGTTTTSGLFNFVVKVVDSSDVPQQKTQALSLTVNSGPPPTSITSCPYVITSPGVYRLDVDCAVSPVQGVGIVIRVSNVDLNLNGHTLSGPGAPATNCSEQGVPAGAPETYGIIVSAAAVVSNIHISGGSLVSFTRGIFMELADGNSISGLTVTGNSTGMTVRTGNNNQFTGNTITQSCGSGFVLQTGNGNQITGNVINNNGNDPQAVQNGTGGIDLSNADNNLIASNDISRNRDIGVRLSDGSDNNTIQNNTVNENGKPLMRSAVGIIIRGFVPGNNNNILGNTTNDNAVGIEVYTAGNVIQNNIVRRNSRGGIALGPFDPPAPNTGNLIQNNTALDNNNTSGFSFADLSDTNSTCVNTWTNNTFVVDNETGAGAGPGAGCVQ